MTRERLNDLARKVIDSNSYMTLGTAGADGHPWVTPVWFASEGYEHFHWVSSPEARHSRNVAARPEVAITNPRARHRGLRKAVRRGRGTQVGLRRRGPPSLFRLYRATASEHYMLIPGRDPENGTGVDRREQVTPSLR
jgi:hypothetical protein